MTPHLGQFSAGLKYAKTDWLRYSPSGEATTLEPWGWTEDYFWQMGYDFGFLTASVGARSLLVRLLAYGMDDEMPFAKLTKVDGEVQGWFGSVHRSIGSGGSEMIAEVEYLKWTGSARGHVEFWPFTSGWVDLLGQRRYFIADTEGWLYRLHIGGRKTCSGGWSVAGGVNLLDIYPHLELQHWRPAFLLFGKEDEQFLTTPVKRTLVGVFNFSLSYQYSFWSVEYGLAQAAPLRTWRPAEVEAAPTPAAPKRAVYGGGFHSLNLVINFPIRRS
jgi:hypothetical protein